MAPDSPQHLYSDLTPWYRLLDPPQDHLGEATSYLEAFAKAGVTSGALLDLGSGAGHNALHLKPRFRCTLADLSEPMLRLSRELNPECEHVQGDMRSLRLGSQFDAVLVHDAVMYMTSETDLARAIETAFLHTRHGGAAVFAPDTFRDSFEEQTELLEEAEGSRALKCLAWAWDPDPADDTFITDYAFLLRDGTEVKAVHDRHVEGLFSKATWMRLLEGVGFGVEMVPRALDDEGAFDEVFLCRRR